MGSGEHTYRVSELASSRRPVRVGPAPFGLLFHFFPLLREGDPPVRLGVVRRRHPQSEDALLGTECLRLLLEDAEARTGRHPRLLLRRLRRLPFAVRRVLCGLDRPSRLEDALDLLDVLVHEVDVFDGLGVDAVNRPYRSCASQRWREHGCAWKQTCNECRAG